MVWATTRPRVRRCPPTAYASALEEFGFVSRARRDYSIGRGHCQSVSRAPGARCDSLFLAEDPSRCWLTRFRQSICSAERHPLRLCLPCRLCYNPGTFAWEQMNESDQPDHLPLGTFSGALVWRAHHAGRRPGRGLCRATSPQAGPEQRPCVECLDPGRRCRHRGRAVVPRLFHACRLPSGCYLSLRLALLPASFLRGFCRVEERGISGIGDLWRHCRGHPRRSHLCLVA
jgi:hypothetical protein